MNFIEHVPYPLQHCRLVRGRWCVVMLLQTGWRVLGTAVFGQNIEEAKQSGSRLETDTGSRCWKLEAAVSAVCDVELSYAGL